MRTEAPTDDALAWTAFLYASGELDPAATADFETRLADDQEAREALAAAVGLVGAVHRVGIESPAVVPMSGRRPVRLLIAAVASVAACLAVVWLRNGLIPDGPSQQSRIASESLIASSDVEVALVWSDLRDDPTLAWNSGTTSDSGEGVPGLAALSSGGSELVRNGAESDAESEDVDLPSWLVAAVALPAASDAEPVATP